MVIWLTYGSANQRLSGKAVPTGIACGATGSNSAGDAPSLQGNCTTVGGDVACVDAANSKGTFTVVASATPDAVPVDTPSTADTCVGYASGGMACNADATVTAPPAPTQSATDPAPAMPAMVVAGGGHTENYYTPQQVTASKGSSGSTGTGGSPAGTTTGTGSGTGGSGSGTGDCVLQPGEVGADDPAGCAGTTPSLTRADTVQSNMQAFYTGLNSSPIVVALNAIHTSMPGAGACPTAVVTLTALTSHSFDFMASACTVFASNLSTLIAISDTVWALVGVLIVMSA